MARDLVAAICLLLLGATCAVAEDAIAPITIGKAAPDITLTGIDGKQFKLSEKTSAGKNVALMFSRAHW